MHVAIIGGGLAGPCLAHGLRRAGFGVTLHERDPEPAKGQGYRIRIAPEGSRALHDCLPEHLHRLVLATAGVPGSAVTVLAGDLTVVNRFPAGDPAAELTPGSGISVDRLTLRTILLAELEEVTRFGAEFTHFVPLPGGRVEARFADGTVQEADLLVGADGSMSRVRRQFLPHARVTDVGVRLVFGKTPLTGEVAAITPPASLDGFSTVVGSGGRFMPLAGHRFRHDPRAAARELGLDLAFADTRDYVMWVLGIPGDLPRLDGAGLRDAVLERIADWHPHLREIVRRVDPATVRTTSMRTSEPLEPWASGPVTLVGDAVHCMVPAGIGAAVALRDAACLTRRLADARDQGSPPAEAVHAYEADMLRYGFEAVAAAAKQAGLAT
ncbi:MAG: FAD-dependent monooxygenase [Nonomuraea sp.]|nr:FAD-dependent monooxygenase [Nonomuraea sp.]NUP67992.1 FAD-dependent monooxygenase [Nonomuraea sp.]NUS09669.1 FAD-dependent monooxygenase [Nonomuraea sp.]NUT41482.1 FAD-dependent monooxygenase [Thermoactinospora sp.]